MTDRHDPDPAERHELTEQDLAIATLVGRYIERREQGAAPRVHDLISVAAEFGDAAVDELRTLLAFYEAMRATELKLLASGTPVRELSARSTNGSLHVAVLWRMREASTALRGVVRSTPIAIDHRSPLGAHETQGSEERP